jgi:hypothetical protein
MLINIIVRRWITYILIRALFETKRSQSKIQTNTKLIADTNEDRPY